MSIVNRRNAVLGWATWQVAKRYAAYKARRADEGGPNKRAIAAAGAAALAGSLLFWRKVRRRHDEQSAGSEGDPE